MDKKPSLKVKLIYKIDCLFSKGMSAMVFFLGIASFSIIIIASIIAVLFHVAPQNSDSLSFLEAFWASLMRTLDAGSMAGDDGWTFRILMLFVTLGGIFIISSLIGVISNGLNSRLENLQRGRSFVVEENHTVILGWNEKVFTIVKELCIANQNKQDACIVIMGELDTISMVESINEKLPSKCTTRIVCRNGSPIDQISLNLLNLNSAKSIIVISPLNDDPDAEVIKTCLAIIRNPNRQTKDFHIVAELREAKNLSVAKIVGGNEVEWVLSENIISKMIAQTCFQPGLSTIYTDLMDFSGDEVYFYNHPSLVGKTFGETLNLFQKNAVLGILKNEGSPLLNPPMETVIKGDDKIILLAEDDNQISLSNYEQDLINFESIRNFDSVSDKPENILIIGWNLRANQLLLEMDHYIPKDSQIQILITNSLVVNSDSMKNLKLINADVKILRGITTDRNLLNSLDLSNFDHIVLLSFSDRLSQQTADSKTLITLLHLRDIASKVNGCHYSILTEMLDVRNLELAEVTKVDDFIVSDRLVSLLITQISERKALGGVFEDIFNPEGSEIYLKSAHNYVELNQEVNFCTIVESARRRNEVAIGFRTGKDATNKKANYGIVLNPHKLEMKSFSDDDEIIVLSESFNG
ncbi:MAG: potassium transporter TrkA [Anaerolineaceae bacterium]